MMTLEGRTALVTGGGTAIGRAIALALAARGARVVVTGREERPLGETVGEIAHGGGKARHLAGDAGDMAHLAAAVGRCVEVFGGVDIVIETEPTLAGCTFGAAASRGPRMVVVGAGAVVEGVAFEVIVPGEGEDEEGVAQRIVGLVAS